MFLLPHEKHSYSKDLDIEEKHIRTTLIQGDDLRLDEHLKMIDKTMEWINAGKYDYKLPTTLIKRDLENCCMKLTCNKYCLWYHCCGLSRLVSVCYLIMLHCY